MSSESRHLEDLLRTRDSLVFDFDGVIVDSDRLHWRAYQLAFDRVGIPFAFEEYLEGAKGRGREEVVASFGASLDPLESIDVAQSKGEEVRRLIREGGVLKPVDGVIEFLRAARARGFSLAVASTSETADLAVDALGLGRFFDCVCAKRRRERSKPHPDVFLRAFDGLGTTPDRCLVIEDTQTGVRAARAAGAAVVVRGSASDWPEQGISREVEAFFDSFDALHSALGWGSLRGSAHVD